MAATSMPDFSRFAQSSIDEVDAAVEKAETSFSDVAGSMQEALGESLDQRPYATLAIAAGLGFLLGVAWAR